MTTHKMTANDWDSRIPGSMIQRMKTNLLTLGGSLGFILAAWGTDVPQAAAAAPPNFVIILADDLGFSDVGCYGGEIDTPHLDQLAQNGLRFTQFYNTARCWPSRAALMTGYYAQQVHRDQIPELGGGTQGRRPPWAQLLPELLAPAGYRSYHSGKWHIDGQPTKTGFHQSYFYNENGRFFSPRSHFLNGTALPAVQESSGFYATTAKVDHARQMLQQHQANTPDAPFLLYLAFIAPHFPLQAPQSDIDKYRTRYLAGWDKLREERFARLKEQGIVATPLSDIERDVGPPYRNPKAMETLGPNEVNRPVPWDSLTESQREFQATKMAIHAAMVDRIDQEVGRLFQQLKEMNAWENTVILFLSDNGASAEILVRDDGHDPAAAPGSAASYLCLGPGFSCLANTPFRRHKTWVHEGGISTPLIVHWPAGISGKGELRRTPGHLIDIVPTFLDAAGVTRPDTIAGETPPSFPGKSLLPVFQQDTDLHRECLWWLHEGNRAVRKGDWKLVAARNQPWELYDLSKDRGESNNLAARHPQQAEELRQLWERELSSFRQLVEQTRDLGKP